MLAILLGMVLVPAAVLIVWFMTPVLRTIMVSTTEGWGAVVGLSGFALAIAEMLPVIVPLMCFAGIAAGLFGLARRGRGI